MASHKLSCASQVINSLGLTLHRELHECQERVGLSKKAEYGDGNVGKTIKLITEDKKCTWICEIKLTFVPSCSQMRLQLLHFHAVFKTWPTFQELTSIVSFRRRRWSQSNFSENRNIQCNQSKDILSKIRGLRRNIFLASRRWRCRPRLLKFPNNTNYTRQNAQEIKRTFVPSCSQTRIQLLHFLAVFKLFKN